MAEAVERRALGALRVLDATTGVPIAEPLAIQGTGVRLARNRRGWYVIMAAPGLPAHVDAFAQPPSTPAVGSVAVELTVADPGGRFLARRCTIRLPRDPVPANAAQPASLFTPIDVALYPSPAARVAPGWAVVRATVSAQGTDRQLAGALIRAIRTSDSARLAAGVSDRRGEALVAVPGIPVTTWEEGPGPVLASELDVTLETVVDPAAPAIPDPDDLEAHRATLPTGSASVRLAAGRVLVAALAVAVP